MTARISLIIAFVVAWSPAHADEKAIEGSAVARAMKAELSRAMTLSLPDAAKPYHVAYTVTDTEEVSVTAEYGGTVTKRHLERRLLGIDMRVGDHSLDNSNFLVFDLDFASSVGGTRLTVDDDYDVLRRQIWLATDRAYKSAAGVLEKKKAVLSSKTEESEPVDDFSKERPNRLVVDEDPKGPSLDEYEALARRLAGVLRKFPIHEGGVTVQAQVTRRYYADSAGSFTYEPRGLVSVSVVCRAQADDGMNLMHHGSVVVPSAADLPAEAALEAEVRRVATELMAIRKAPAAKAYAGPVLFEGAAAAQLVRELVAKNMSGTPAPKLSESRYAVMFSSLGLETKLGDKVGKKVLPAGFTVVDDPGLKSYGGKALVGHYRVDGEGMQAKKVRLVERGKLLGFLMSRTPRKDFAKSTGHGRAAATGARAQASNLIVTATRGVPAKTLRKRLLKEAKAAGEDFAVVIRLLDDTSITSSYAGGASNIFMMGAPRGRPSLPRPLVAVKVTPNGKEEYLRGFSLEAIPMRALKEIIATSREVTVHNHARSGGGGAASMFFGGGGADMLGPGASPSSVVTPALLFKVVELGASKGPKAKPPVLPRP